MDNTQSVDVDILDQNIDIELLTLEIVPGNKIFSVLIEDASKTLTLETLDVDIEFNMVN